MDLDELERLHREATPGPWRCVEHSYGGCKVTNEEGDAILLEDDFRLIAAMRNALPQLISRARLYEQMDRHACDQVAEIDRLRVRIAEADRDRDTWATSAHKIANERDAAARDLAAVTAERDAARAGCERLRDITDHLHTRLAEVGRERDEAMKQLRQEEIAYNIADEECEAALAKVAALESLAEDARTCAEWCKHMDVGSGAETGAAARRVLAGIGGK